MCNENRLLHIWCSYDVSDLSLIKMQAKVKDGQTLADIAIQEYGALEAVVQIAIDNSMSVSDVPQAGTILHLHDKTYNRVMHDYCWAHSVQPATQRGYDTSASNRIFNEVFNDIFN